MSPLFMGVCLIVTMDVSLLRFTLVGLIAAPLLAACSGSEPDQPPPAAPPADHHVHIRSEASSRALARLQEALSGQEMEPPPPTEAEHAIALLDSAGIERGTLLSLAYFFGIPDVDFENEYERVRAENDFVIEEAAQFPDRLLAFCSVNPFADYARREMERCARNDSAHGLKLHLANSQVDLREADDVAVLSETFQQAERLDLPVVVHLFTRNPDYGARDVQIFTDSVLSTVPDLPVQIAHLGAAGPFDATTDSVVAAFRREIDDHPDLFDDDVVFDLGATALNPDRFLAQGDTARAEEIEVSNARLARHVDQLGPRRIVFGTDWIGGARRPPTYVELFQRLLGEETVRTVFTNTAPYLETGA